jgi:hypothetical protein
VQWKQTVILWLWKASIATQFLLCIRLAATGLRRSYPRLFTYVAALTAESCILIGAARSPYLYEKVWVATRAAVLVVEVLAVLEIFGRWSDSYPGIGRFGQRLLVLLFVLATGLSLSMLPVKWSSSDWVFATYLMSVANRSVQTGLAAFLLLMLLFFMKFGGPVAPNLKRHTWAMTAFLTANVLSYFLITARVYQLGNTLLQMISLAALVYWIFAFRRSGEEIPVTPNNPQAWAAAEEMNRQLLDFAGSVKQSRRGAVRK